MGTITMHCKETPKGSFHDEESFEPGATIAITSVRWQNVLNVQAPDAEMAPRICVITPAGKAYIRDHPT